MCLPILLDVKDFQAAYVPSARSSFTELSRTPTGKLWRKRILKFGSFPHPADPSQTLTIDEALADKVVENFNNGVCDIVQIPLAGDGNAHTEDVTRNIGEVIDVDVQLVKDPERAPDGPGVYANMDIRKPEYADAPGRTLLGTSAMLHMDYPDTRTGERVGPTLIHTLMTNRPYLTDLGDYREVVAASADTFDQDEIVVFGAQEESDMPPTREESLEALRNDPDDPIDVVALQARVTELEEAAPADNEQLVGALSNVLGAAGLVRFSQNGDEAITIEDVSEGVIELSQELAARDSRIGSLEAQAQQATEQAAQAEVDGLVSEGRVLPTARDTMVALAQTDREAFTSLVSPHPIVQMSEKGVTVFDTRNEDLNGEIERLRSIAQPRAEKE